MINKSFLKIIVIYVYLLFFIVIMLYKEPGFIVSKKQNVPGRTDKFKYSSDNYLNDKKMFCLENMYFPIAFSDDNKECILFEDTYGDSRSYGGERIHEGCDIMTKNNIRGEFPIVAVCDGYIEKIGWLELGGYRVGLRSETGVYYYYAHLYRYEEGLSEGMKVYAGQILGYIGDSGYSKVQGTTGNFDVHLHFGIYLTDKKGNEYTVNPYNLLKRLKKSVIQYNIKTK